VIEIIPREAIVSPYNFKTSPGPIMKLCSKKHATLRWTDNSTPTPTVAGREWERALSCGHRGQGDLVRRIAMESYPTLCSHWLTEEYPDTNGWQAALSPTPHTIAPQWPAQDCWPDRLSCAAGLTMSVTNQPHSVIVTPTLVQFLAGDADNFITNIHIGRSFNMSGAVPRLGPEVAQWYGDTIGFWDGDALITWTSNVVGWKVHGNPEFSNKLQSIEIYTPKRDASGKFVGLNHEGIFYDPKRWLNRFG
jgi:hypothetical protein